MDTYEIAAALMTATDEELAETFAYAAKLKEMAVHGPNSQVPETVNLSKRDFDNPVPFMNWLSECVREISTCTQVCTSVWWKQRGDNDIMYTYRFYREDDMYDFCAPNETIAKKLFYQRCKEQNIKPVWNALEMVYVPSDAEKYGERYGLKRIRCAYDIVWDTDETDENDLGLPDTVKIPNGINEDDISNYLSDTYGFCVFSYSLSNEIKEV